MSHVFEASHWVEMLHILVCHCSWRWYIVHIIAKQSSALQWYERYTTVNFIAFPCRIIWALIVLVACGLFVAINVENVVKLTSHLKTVSVEVSYEPSLPFPAVTICNSNAFKSVNMMTSWHLIVLCILALCERNPPATPYKGTVIRCF